MTPGQLAHAYATCVDAGDVEGLTALFTPDCVLVVPDPPVHLGPVIEHHGHEGLRAALAPLSAFASTRHEVESVEVDGSFTATIRVSVPVSQQMLRTLSLPNGAVPVQVTVVTNGNLVWENELPAVADGDVTVVEGSGNGTAVTVVVR